ncbi:hypothetical protein M885DRAFT_604110 [Pelagophyceae sp. CCMP2097]|nr:hypothetical protein M885DRAFT_604110 [Pelagophyceae sp. CCMP2097]
MLLLGGLLRPRASPLLRGFSSSRKKRRKIPLVQFQNDPQMVGKLEKHYTRVVESATSAAKQVFGEDTFLLKSDDRLVPLETNLKNEVKLLMVDTKRPVTYQEKFKFARHVMGNYGPKKVAHREAHVLLLHPKGCPASFDVTVVFRYTLYKPKGVAAEVPPMTFVADAQKQAALLVHAAMLEKGHDLSPDDVDNAVIDACAAMKSPVDEQGHWLGTDALVKRCIRRLNSMLGLSKEASGLHADDDEISEISSVSEMQPAVHVGIFHPNA